MRRSSTRVRHRGGMWHSGIRSALAVALVASVGAGITGIGPARAQTGSPLSTASFTPAGALFYAEVSLDTDSPQLRAFDDILARLGSEESLVDAIEESATDPESDIDLTDAEVAVAVLPSAVEAGAHMSGDLIGGASGDGFPGDLESAGEEGIVIVIRSGDIDALAAKAKESAGIGADTEEYLGVEITTDPNADSSIQSFAVVDDYLFGGATVADVKAIIDVAEGTADSLADEEQFQTVSELLPSERLAFAFSNGPALIDAVTESLEDRSMSGLVRESLAAYSGYSGLVVSADEPGIRFETVVVPEAGTAGATPSGTAADLDMASRMPIDTAVFASGFDLGETVLLNGLGATVAGVVANVTARPTGDRRDDGTPTPIGDSQREATPVSIDDMYESMALLFGFNLKTDFIDQLVGPYGFGIWGIEGDDPSNLSAVLVSGVDDVMVLDDTLGTISVLIQAGAQGEVNVTSRPLAGERVNHIEFDAEGSPVSVDYGIIGGEFVLGVGEGADTVMDAPAESLADSSSYTRALSYLPDEYQSVFYVDVAQISTATEGVSDGRFNQDDLMPDMGTPAAGTPPESFASVTHVDDGNVYTSAILVAP